MAVTVNVHEAKTHFSRLLEHVAQGQEVVIARAGKPIARLVPLAPVERPLGFVPGVFDESFWEPLPEGELAAWEGQG
jgi:prevent-host-death family protein